MIKINLLKNQGDAPTKGDYSQINYETSVDNNFSATGSAEKKGLVLKVLLMLIGVAGLLAYESYNIGELNSKIAQKNQQQTALTAEIEQKKPIAEKARELQVQLQDLEARIKAIKDLSRIRLREIKAIDYVQNIIPERVWLTSIDMVAEKVDFNGGALSDDQLNRFMEALSSKSNFKNVILLKAIEQKSKEGTIKIFNITSSLTNAD